jgi:hypothetical protein
MPRRQDSHSSSRTSHRTSHKSSHKSSHNDGLSVLVLPPPPRTYPSQHVESSSPGLLTGLGQGIAIGAGSSIGHRVVSSVFGSSSPPQEEPKKDSSRNCELQFKRYVECSDNFQAHSDTCHDLLDDYMKCMKTL